MYALPSYFLNDIGIIEENLNALSFPTDFLIPNLEVIKVYWEGVADAPAGEFRFNKNSNQYVFYVNEDTLSGITEGES